MNSYEERVMATALNLQKYYNQCIGIMLSDMEKEEKMEALQDMDRQWAIIIVDAIAPKKILV